MPYHRGMHWMLHVVDVAKRVVRFYDSLGGEDQRACAMLLRWLEEEWQVRDKYLVLALVPHHLST